MKSDDGQWPGFLAHMYRVVADKIGETEARRLWNAAPRGGPKKRGRPAKTAKSPPPAEEPLTVFFQELVRKNRKPGRQPGPRMDGPEYLAFLRLAALAFTEAKRAGRPANKTRQIRKLLEVLGVAANEKSILATVRRYEANPALVGAEPVDTSIVPQLHPDLMSLFGLPSTLKLDPNY